MIDYLMQIEEAIKAVVIHSDSTYSWFGKRSEPLPSKIKKALSAETARNCLLYSLQHRLYDDFYSHGHTVLSSDEAATNAAAPQFLRSLSEANCGKGSELEMLGLTSRQKELFGYSPGFYTAIGDAPFDKEGDDILIRIYWNLESDGAVRFIKAVVTMMNRSKFPFRLKTANAPQNYNRCDAAVLYVNKSKFHAASEILKKIYREVFGCLKPKTPAFTKALAPGVGLAEDPGSEESFGHHRCRILADAIIRAYELKKRSAKDRLHVVVERFSEYGIEIERPYLNSGSTDDYNLHFQSKKGAMPSQNEKSSALYKPNKKAYLQTALRIGKRLLQDAVWSGDRCNWLGFMTREDHLDDRESRAIYGALGADLYSGTCGIALFLAELYLASEKAETRRAAMGAIRQAVRHAETASSPYPSALYSGGLGVALAAARIGHLLNESVLLEDSQRIVQRAFKNRRVKREYDLIYGDAGAIAALTILKEMLNDASLLEFAVKLGDDLMRAAKKTEAGYSWGTPAAPNARHLTGFSHGTAGIGYALLELFHATGEEKHRKAAERAFDYERHWFDPQSGNWPDMRDAPARGKLVKSSLAFTAKWCHGAPGISLSRLRAHQILNDARYKDEAIAALRTTHKTTVSTLHSGMWNYSLCHGLAGNAEILLDGERMLGGQIGDHSALAYEIANKGIRLYGEDKKAWPCGISAGETPGLMLGLAGIGYFYLRLYNPSVPSVLILRREDF